MYTLDELKERYGKAPRPLDTHLRPLLLHEGGQAPVTPWGKIIFSTLLTVVALYGLAVGMGYNVEQVFFIGSPLLLGVPAWFLRSASLSFRNGHLLRESPFTLAALVDAHPRLLQVGDAPERAVVLFTTDEATRMEPSTLRELAKKLKGAPTELPEVAELLKNRPARGLLPIPSALAGDRPLWLAVVTVDPNRLDKGKIVDGIVPLIVAPSIGFVAHV